MIIFKMRVKQKTPAEEKSSPGRGQNSTVSLYETGAPHPGTI